MLSTITGVGEEALRTTMRSISGALCVCFSLSETFFASLIATVLWPPFVVTSSARPITSSGGVPAGRPVAGVPVTFSLLARAFEIRTSKRPVTFSLTEYLTRMPLRSALLSDLLATATAATGAGMPALPAPKPEPEPEPAPEPEPERRSRRSRWRRGVPGAGGRRR